MKIHRPFFALLALAILNIDNDAASRPCRAGVTTEDDKAQEAVRLAIIVSTNKCPSHNNASSRA